MAWSVSFCPWKTNERRWREDAYPHTVYSHIYEFSLGSGAIQGDEDIEMNKKDKAFIDLMFL